MTTTEEKKEVLSEPIATETTPTSPIPPKKSKKKGILLGLFIGALCLFLAVSVTIGGILTFILLNKWFSVPPVSRPAAQKLEIINPDELPSWVTVDLLTLDGASRTGEPLEELNAIAVHYVANPGTTAKNNRDYFEGPDSDTSSHFIVGLEGEVIQCIPLNEKSCATNERNRDTISIEVCHPDATGEFSPVTRQSLVRLLAYLCQRYGLDADTQMIRHYDVTGKLCPLYYVQNEEAWFALKADVAAWKEPDYE